MEQRIKNYTGISLILFLLVASYAVFQYVTSYSRVGQIARTFSVSGQEKVVGVPDVAQFSFGVITQGGKNVKALQNENTQKGNEIIGFVKSQGVSEKDIQTQSYIIEPRYQKEGFIVGYTVRQAVLVKIRDFAAISSILSGVAERGANSVSQLSFTIDDLTTLQNQARTKAIAKARLQAEAVAKAGGFVLGRLVSLEEGRVFPGPVPLFGAATSKESAGPAIEPGTQEIQVTATLTYEIQ